MGKTEYFKKAYEECKKVGRTTGKPAFMHMIDFLYCYARYGCIPRQYSIGEFYKLRGFDRKRTLTYGKILDIYKRLNNPEAIHYLENKVEFNQHFSRFINRDWIYPTTATAEELEAFLRKHGSVIVKPLLGVEGHGIHKYTLDNTKETDFNTLKSEWSKIDVIVEEFILQHPEMKFGNTAVNTIRPMTMLDPNGKAHIIRAVLRAGVGNNIVDNYCSGGVIYPLDPVNGIVDGKGIFRKGNDVLTHPGTDQLMLGYKIPYWKELVSKVNEAAESFPQCKFIGWDVAITSDGKIELIEGNHNPDYEFYEFLNHPFAFEEIQKHL